MAGYRRSRQGATPPTKRARQAQRHRDELQKRLAASNNPHVRLGIAYRYALAAHAHARRRGREKTPASHTELERATTTLVAVGDRLFTPGGK